MNQADLRHDEPIAGAIQSSGTTIRVDDPPASMDCDIEFSASQAGVCVRLYEADDCTECLEWYVSFDALVDAFLGHFRSPGGQLQVEEEDRQEFAQLADALERAAQMVRRHASR